MYITHPPYLIGNDVYALGVCSLEKCSKSDLLSDDKINLFDELPFFDASSLDHDSGN